MTIEPYVIALQSGNYDAYAIPSLNDFLAGYRGKPLFKYIAESQQYLLQFNNTLTRFAMLIKEHPPTEETSELFALVFEQGLAILCAKLIKDYSDNIIAAIIENPLRYFSFLQSHLQPALMSLREDFIPEYQITKMLRESQNSSAQLADDNTLTLDKPTTIKMSSCSDYADKRIINIATRSNVSFSPSDVGRGFTGHAPGIAFIHNYAPTRPLFVLNVENVPPMLVSTLINQLLDFGIRNIRMSTSIKQPTSTLFTNPQEAFVQKKVYDVTLHYFLVMGPGSSAPFDLIVKPTGLVPGPLTLTASANKHACADYLVNALPCLLPNQTGDLHIDNKNNNPSLLAVDSEKNTQRIDNLQKSLPASLPATFVWILFENASQYIYDIYLYADRVEPGFFTRSGCGDMALLKDHMPTVTDIHAVTTHVALSAPRTPPNTPTTPKRRLSQPDSPKKIVEHKF